MLYKNYRINILGCPIDNLTLKETIALIDKMIQSRESHQHVVINAAKLLELRRNSRLKEIISSCDIINVDSMPIVWASRILGRPLKERITGTDLMEYLIEHSAKNGYRVYFLGAKEEVIKKVVAAYKTIYLNLQIAGYRNGYWNYGEEDEVANAIHKASPDILFVAFGSPKKEFFIKKYLDTMRVPFTMGVGGSFDVVAGLTRRAPKWMQRIGLEWFWRFIQEPGRLWKRYLIGNTVFVLLVLKEIVKIRILRKIK